jgi:mRNA-degrading endonuclease RelE of RelBE toxin-antitoxin system
MADYRLVYSETAKNQIVKLHPELKSIIRSRLDMLSKEPFKGKQLARELSGYRSLRAARFRIIYKLNEAEKNIEVHYIGHRKDVYELFAERTGRFFRNDPPQSLSVSSVTAID